jgi:lincosamide nucleotidyltransferase A/C/D/E
VLAALRLLASAHCPVWIDGGWGVDALLGRQTRLNADLDLAIALTDVSIMKKVLGEALG